MGKILLYLKRRIRLWVQLGVSALTNGYASGFVGGKIFTGPSKAYCVPGLNCYSCPGALGSCPIGALQAVLGSRDYRFAFYLTGFFMMIGAVLGRFVCGWLCPFGLVQDLLYKIPFVKKLKKLPGDRWLKWLKYVLLIGFVILLPLFVVDVIGQGSPGFCKYICPSGTLGAGIPLLLANPSLREAAGWLFAWKGLLLAVLIVLSILVYRPFCRYLCPLGAIYGIFNPIAFYQIRVDKEKCTSCGACRRACKLDIPVWKRPNSPECIRCGDCGKACSSGALCAGFQQGKNREAHQKEGTV